MQEDVAMTIREHPFIIIYFLDNIFDYPDTSVIIRKCPINPKILSSSPNSARLNGLT